MCVSERDSLWVSICYLEIKKRECEINVTINMINPRHKVSFGEIHESQSCQLSALNSRPFLPLLPHIYLRRSRKVDADFHTHYLQPFRTTYLSQLYFFVYIYSSKQMCLQLVTLKLSWFWGHTRGFKRDRDWSHRVSFVNTIMQMAKKCSWPPPNTPLNV